MGLEIKLRGVQPQTVNSALSAPPNQAVHSVQDPSLSKPVSPAPPSPVVKPTRVKPKLRVVVPGEVAAVPTTQDGVPDCSKGPTTNLDGMKAVGKLGGIRIDNVPCVTAKNAEAKSSEGYAYLQTNSGRGPLYIAEWRRRVKEHAGNWAKVQEDFTYLKDALGSNAEFTGAHADQVNFQDSRIDGLEAEFEKVKDNRSKTLLLLKTVEFFQN